MRSSSSPRRQQTDRRRRIALGAAAGCLFVAAVSAVVVVGDDGEEDPTRAAAALPFRLEQGKVYAYDTRFQSVATVRVAVGDKLTFDNRDDEPHTFTSDQGLFDSGPIGPGRTYGYAYVAPGTYGYHCEIHPTMRGSVVVAGS